MYFMGGVFRAADPDQPEFFLQVMKQGADDKRRGHAEIRWLSQP
jgi:hypothetical protein